MKAHRSSSATVAPDNGLAFADSGSDSSDSGLEGLAKE